MQSLITVFDAEGHYTAPLAGGGVRIGMLGCSYVYDFPAEHARHAEASALTAETAGEFFAEFLVKETLWDLGS